VAAVAADAAVSGGHLAGALSERVTLLRRAETRDALGGAVVSWADGGLRWAALVPAGEADGTGDRPFGVPRWSATLRAGVAVAPGDRLMWRDRLVGVLAVTADPATPDRLTLKLEEVA
jgi:head-tail adaptor